MIIDAHSHAWERWPYSPEVPDPATRGRAEELLWEMEANAVAKAILICAAIGGNTDNNRYATAMAERSGGRLLAFVDVDSRWLPTHHTPGAAGRLRHAIATYRPLGITHYLHEDADPGWLVGADGKAFLAAASDAGVILSLACGPSQMPVVCEAARRFPELPILLHHLVRVRAGSAQSSTQLEAVLAGARCPNLHVKVSGFGYGVDDGWDYPCAPMLPIVRAIAGAYGPGRLVWGSDHPVSRRYMTYRQTLEIVRRHCDFLSADDCAAVLGGTMARLLDEAARRTGG